MEIINLSIIIFIIFAPGYYFWLIFTSQKKGGRKSLIPIVFLAVITVILLRKLIFSTSTLAQADANHFNLPFFEFFGKSIRRFGQPPIWNPYFDAGFDMFSHPLASYFSPTLTLSFIKNIYVGWNLKIVLDVILAAVFSYFLFFSLFNSANLGLIGSVVYTFNGYTMQRLSEGLGTEYLFSIKWLPLLLLFTYKFVEKRRLKDLLLLSIAIGFSFEGSPNVAFYAIAGTFIFFLTLAIYKIKENTSIAKRSKVFTTILGEVWKYSYYFLLSAFIALLIYAIKIIPVMGIYNLTNQERLLKPIVGHRTMQVEFASLLQYFFPIIPKEGRIPIFTPGVIALLLITIGAVIAIRNYKKDKNKNLTTAFSLILLTGSLMATVNPISQSIINLPIVNRITVIPASISLIVISLPYFAVLGATFVLNKIDKFLIPLGLLFSFMFFIQDKTFYKLLDMPDNQILITKIVMMVITPLGLLVLNRVIKKLKPLNTNYIYSILLCLLIFSEILLGPATFGNSSYSFNFPKFDYSKEINDFRHLDRLKELLKKGGRAYFSHHNRNYLVIAPMYAVIPRDIEIFSNNPYYFAPAWTIKTQEILDKSLESEQTFTNEELWNLTGIKYIVLTNELEKEPGYRYLDKYKRDFIPFEEFREHKELTSVFNQKDLFPWDEKTVKIFENPKFAPKYLFVPKGKNLTNYKKVAIIKESLLDLELRIPKEKGEVLISRTYYPYWRYQLGDKNGRVQKNAAFIKVYTDGSSERLTLKYVPIHIYIGFGISLTAFTVFVFLFSIRKTYVNKKI